MDPFVRDSITARLAPSSDRTAWIESGVLLLLTFGIGYLVNPDDPLFVNSAFPWPVVSPLLIGLRYGFAHAFVNALALLLIAFSYSALHDAATWPIPISYSFGIALVAMLAGEFRDIWETRISTLERSNEYRQARLEEFTHTFQILKISHDRLEQANAGSPNSLRSALMQLTTLGGKPEEFPQVADELLKLLNSYCSVQSASIYETAQTTPIQLAVATIGRGCALRTDDVVVANALRKSEAVAVDTSSGEILKREHGQPLICIPLLDVYQKSHGILVIEELPFFAFNKDVIQLMSIICAYASDHLGSAIPLSLPEKMTPDTRDFGRQLRRCVESAKTQELPFSLLAMSFTDQSMALNYADTITLEARGLDVTYVLSQDDERYLLVLMPLTPEQGIDNYMLRLNTFMIAQYGDSPAALGIHINRFTGNASTRHQDVEAFVASRVGGRHELLTTLEDVQAVPA